MLIDLEPAAYRETGRQRLIRSILHRPVFMTISTALGLWVAACFSIPTLADGVFAIPVWMAWCLLASLPTTAIFFVWAALNDQDRLERPKNLRPGQRSPVSLEKAQKPGAPTAEIAASGHSGERPARQVSADRSHQP